MNEMSVEEYIGHAKDSFVKEHFNGNDDFVFSQGALEEGLSMVEVETIVMEMTIEDIIMPNLIKKELKNTLRKSQVVVNILKRCLDGINIKIVSKSVV